MTVTHITWEDRLNEIDLILGCSESAVSFADLAGIFAKHSIAEYLENAGDDGALFHDLVSATVPREIAEAVWSGFVEDALNQNDGAMFASIDLGEETMWVSKFYEAQARAQLGRDE